MTKPTQPRPPGTEPTQLRPPVTDRVTVGNLRVAKVLHDFINNEALPGTGLDPDSFWAGVDKVVTDLTPRNEELLARRDELQAQLDKWHRQRVIGAFDIDDYKEFLGEIGYLQPEPADFTITTSGVDDEITTTAGPQLVVPILNARFALNAANARWGSLYDALYGTDVIPEDDGAEKGTSYNRVRGDKVIAYARNFLDEAVPLAIRLAGRHHRADHRRRSAGGRPRATDRPPGSPARRSSSGTPESSASPDWSVLLVNNGLHIEILDRSRLPRRFDRRGRRQGRGAGVGDHHDHGLRGLRRGRRRRRQGARLPQLARPEPGRPRRRGQQGRQDVHPRAECRPHVHRPRRWRADAARAAACCSCATSGT